MPASHAPRNAMNPLCTPVPALLSKISPLPSQHLPLPFLLPLHSPIPTVGFLLVHLAQLQGYPVLKRTLEDHVPTPLQGVSKKWIIRRAPLRHIDISDELGLLHLMHPVVFRRRDHLLQPIPFFQSMHLHPLPRHDELAPPGIPVGARTLFGAVAGQEVVINGRLQGKTAEATTVAAVARFIVVIQCQKASVRSEVVVEFAPKELIEVTVLRKRPLRLILSKHGELGWVIEDAHDVVDNGLAFAADVGDQVDLIRPGLDFELFQVHRWVFGVYRELHAQFCYIRDLSH